MSERALALLRIRRMIAKELRQLLRDPKSKRMIFGAPIIQLLLFGYAVNTDVRNVATFLVDRDRTAASRQLVQAFTASGYFRVVGTSDRASDLGDALDRGTARVGLEIPAGYAADLKGGRSPAVQLLLDGTNSNTATVAGGYARQIVQSENVEVAAASGALLPRAVELRARAWFNPSLSSRIYNVPAVIGAILFMMCLLLTALAVVRERETGTLEQLLVSPLSAGELILGKTIPVAGIALVQMALISTVAILWFDVPLRGSIPALLVAAGLFIVAGLSLGLFISTISNTQQEAFLSMFLFLLPAVILSGFLYPIDTMPTFFEQLTMINPLRHFLWVVRAIFLKGAGFADVWRETLILGVMAAIGLVVAVGRLRGMRAG
jgi:ABC-2 type transport system permease protein